MFDVYFPLFEIIMISVWRIVSINYTEDDLMYILESWEIDQSCHSNNRISGDHMTNPFHEQTKTSINPCVHTSCVKVKPINLILPLAELDQTQWI